MAIDSEVVCDPDTLMPVPPATTGAVIVTAPVDADTVTPVPANAVTPLFVTVRVVVPAMETPVPAASDAAIVGVVVPVTVMPLPAVTDVTPAAPPPLVPSGPDIVIRSPNRRRLWHRTCTP